MRKVNIANPEFKHSDTDPEGYDAGMFRMGPMVGASILGATVYELRPATRSAPTTTSTARRSGWSCSRVSR